MLATLPRKTLQFQGPPNFHCLGTPYFTLTHSGRKAEGDPIPGGLVKTPEEAWALFNAQLLPLVVDADQIAWRQTPALEEQAGLFKVVARLAIYPNEEKA